MLVRPTHGPLSAQFQTCVDILDEKDCVMNLEQLRRIERLIINNRSILHERTAEGSTLLHHSAGINNEYFADLFIKEYILRLILHLGADLNAQNNLGATPLHIAAKRSDSNVVKLFLELGAKCLVNSLSQTPLHVYIQQHIDAHTIAQFYKYHPASIDQEDKNGDTPLHLAFKCNHYSFSEFIKLCKPSDMIANRLGETISYQVESIKSKDRVFEPKKIYHIDLLHGCIARGEFDRLIAIDNWQLVLSSKRINVALRAAARFNRLAIMTYLFAQCTEDGIKQLDLKSLFQTAIHSASFDIVKFLLARDPSLLLRKDHFYLPLIMAARMGSIAMVTFILEQLQAAGVSEEFALLEPNPNNSGDVLYYAAANNHLPLVKWLCEKNLYPLKVISDQNNSLLNTVIMNGDLEMLTYLLDEQHLAFKFHRYVYGGIHIHPDMYENMIQRIDLLDTDNQAIFRYFFSKKYDYYYNNLLLAREFERQLQLRQNVIAGSRSEEVIKTAQQEITDLIRFYQELLPAFAAMFVPTMYLQNGEVEKAYESYDKAYLSVSDLQDKEYIQLSIAEMFLTQKIRRADLPLPIDENEVTILAAVGALPHVFGNHAAQMNSSIAVRMQNMTLFYLFGHANKVDTKPNLALPFDISAQSTPCSISTILLLSTYLHPRDFPEIAPIVTKVMDHSLKLLLGQENSVQLSTGLAAAAAASPRLNSM